MKKVLFLIVSALILALVFTGCETENSGIIPSIERSAIEISCDYTYATDVFNYYQGTQINGHSIKPGRDLPENATGELDHSFFALGFFSSIGPPGEQDIRGWIILDFEQMVGGCINVIEQSPKLADYYPVEQAEVWVNDDLAEDWVYLGMATNQTPELGTLEPDCRSHPNFFLLDGCIRYVKIIDMTDPHQWASGSTADGFDVDAVYADQCVVQCVPVDIKPTSCPNPINTEGKGVLPVAILGMEDFDVNQVDPGSIKLKGVSPLRWALEDVATPYVPYIGNEDCMDCNKYGPDGYTDLTLKFDKQEIVAALGEVEDGDCLVLILQGELIDGTPIYGEDVVKILKKGK